MNGFATSGFVVHVLDDRALEELASELRRLLVANDHDGLVAWCSASREAAEGAELTDVRRSEIAAAINAWPARLVDVFLVDTSHADARVVRVAVREASMARVSRASKALASRVIDELARNVASDAPPRVAGPLLSLLDETKTPFFLRDPERSLGRLTSAERAQLVEAARGIDVGALDELLDALRGIDSAVLLERV